MITENIKANVKISKNASSEYYSPWDVAAYVWPQIKSFTWNDNFEQERAPTLEYMLSIHMVKHSEFLYDWCAKLYKHLKNNPKNNWVGDMDVYADIIFDKNGKTVFLVNNTCSCADVTQWIVVWTRNQSKESIHVRQIHDKSDYPRKQYPEKLGINFYKARNFVMEYVEKYHMTKLGGVYGDMRDKGYILSIEKYIGELAKLNCEPSLRHDKEFYFYNDWRHAMFNFHWLESLWTKKEN